jgi:hypothetical protein
LMLLRVKYVSGNDSGELVELFVNLHFTATSISLHALKKRDSVTQ